MVAVKRPIADVFHAKQRGGLPDENASAIVTWISSKISFFGSPSRALSQLIVERVDGETEHLSKRRPPILGSLAVPPCFPVSNKNLFGAGFFDEILDGSCG